ncbi:hypothetical protein VTK56DRAFT_5830 [Thermocarpiscus australiensis]
MSSPAQGEPSAPHDTEKDKGGIGKLLTRTRKVLRKADQSRRPCMLGSEAGPSGLAAPAVRGVVLSEPIQVAVPQVLATVEAPRLPRAELFAERAKELGELYGLALKPSERDSIDGHAVRIEKPARMRVRRTCHLCDTSFGPGKECPKCKHPRCAHCLWLPLKPDRNQLREPSSSLPRPPTVARYELVTQRENAPVVSRFTAAAPINTATPTGCNLERFGTGGEDGGRYRPCQRRRCESDMDPSGEITYLDRRGLAAGIHGSVPETQQGAARSLTPSNDRGNRTVEERMTLSKAQPELLHGISGLLVGLLASARSWQSQVCSSSAGFWHAMLPRSYLKMRGTEVF